MNKILSKEITFDLAKLLKEKGFDIPKNKMYCKSIPMFEHHHVVKFHDGDKHECLHSPYDWNNTKSPISSTTYYTAPTISEVVDWIFKKYNIWISVSIDEFYEFTWNMGATTYKTGDKAYEEAIKYILENY